MGSGAGGGMVWCWRGGGDVDGVFGDVVALAAAAHILCGTAARGRALRMRLYDAGA